MLTGIETAGLILAVLPLIVNQLDGYVQGLQTIKTFSGKRYRRELESYLVRLGTQRAILLNTLENLLQDVVDAEEEVQVLIDDPRGVAWQNPDFQAKLRRRLGRDHDIYVRNMSLLAGLLSTLSEKLGLEKEKAWDGKLPFADVSTFEREVKKFRDIFNKSTYQDLLNKIDNANIVLERLTRQSTTREVARSRRRTSQKPLAAYRRARLHARGLHNAVIKGKCWKCPCRALHIVNFRLEQQNTDPPQTDGGSSYPLRFRLALSTTVTGTPTAPPAWHWQEVDTEAAEDIPQTPLDSSASLSITASFKSTRRVQFAILSKSTSSSSTPLSTQQLYCMPIADMCTAICGVASCESHDPIGYIFDEADARRRYNIYLAKKLAKEVHTRSLADLLGSERVPSRRKHGGRVFSRRDRLLLAATLASSVFQLHGSWLKTQWRSSDIVFPDTQDAEQILTEFPYVSNSLLDELPESNGTPKLQRTASALIRSEVLFPLGLALIELSLGQTLSSMREAEDNDPVEAITDLKTASRLLQDVCYESGSRYGDVVERCLFWTGSKESGLDDEQFQQAVFDSVVAPLLDDYKDFEGKARIR